MKRIICVLMLTSLLAVSCSKEKVNDIKLQTAEKVGTSTEKALKEAYVGISIENINCEDEAEKIGSEVKNKVLSFLKAEVPQSIAPEAKTVVGSVLPTVCIFVVQNVLPNLITDASSSYACLRTLGADKLKSVGTDLCTAIEL